MRREKGLEDERTWEHTWSENRAEKGSEPAKGEHQRTMGMGIQMEWHNKDQHYMC